MSDRRSTRLSPEALADLALDGDVSLDRALAAAGGRSARVVGHVRAVRRLERLLRLERSSARTPDFTAAILGEVEARRGWLDPRSRRLVWSGRLLAAAALLLAIGLTLSVRRAAPGLADAPPESRALASMVHAGQQAASEATAPLSAMVRTIESREPVIATLGRLTEGAPGLATFAPESSAGRAVMISYAQSPAPSAGHAGGTVRFVAHVELDPLSRRTIETATGSGQPPRWVRLMSTGGRTRAPIAPE